MNREKVIQLAKAGYNWLIISPVVTMFTLYTFTAMDIGGMIWANFSCTDYYNDTASISYGTGERNTIESVGEKRYEAGDRSRKRNTRFQRDDRNGEYSHERVRSAHTRRDPERDL